VDGAQPCGSPDQGKGSIFHDVLANPIDSPELGVIRKGVDKQDDRGSKMDDYALCESIERGACQMPN
jgi:hypothetical protein